MNPNPKSEEGRMLGEAFPHSASSSELSARVADIGQQTLMRKNRRRVFKRGLTLAGTVACLAGGAIIFPTVRAYAALYKMNHQIQDVSSAHLTFYSVDPSGKRTLSRQLWYQDGQWRIEMGRRLTLYKQGKLYDCDPDTGQALVKEKADGPFSYNSSGFTMTSEMADMAQWHWGEKIETNFGVMREGRRVNVFTMTSEHMPDRCVTIVDPKTDLPIEYDVQADRDGDWQTVEIGFSEFNKPYEAALFTPDTKKWRIVDSNNLKDQWEHRLEANQLAVRKLKHGELVVRDLQMSRAGSAYILFTVPSTVRWWDIAFCMDATDQDGNRYVPSGNFQVSSQQNENGPRGPRGWWIANEPVVGVWLVPVNKPATWKPTTLNIRVYFNQEDKLAGSIGFQAKGTNQIVFMREWKCQGSDLLSKTFTEPTCDKMPAYMPFVEIGPIDDETYENYSKHALESDLRQKSLQ